ncbi:3-methyladenine DNA glycosylase [Haloferax larsenii JCM 13917]|nr:DNA-3-methyladenine glycosylase [Haloferax larsenii]ELZ78177.1 3-methyladenine DNA glycosylase [Haloferax larsenii JCM 13917]
MTTIETLSPTQVQITPTLPFDFAPTLELISGFRPCSDDNTCRNGSLTIGGYADQIPFVASVSAEAPPSLTIHVDWVTEPGDEHSVTTWIRKYLSLDDDLAALYEAATADPAFRSIVDDLYGYHHVRFPTPFEAACWAALSQRTPWHVSKRLKRALVSVAGKVVERNGEEIALFPTPTRVLAVADDLEDAVENDRKRKTILSAAQAFSDESLSELDDEALHARLGEIWGFGPWSSEFVFLRGFGRMNRMPVSERRLRDAVADLYNLSSDTASESDLHRLSKSYEPYVGYWAHYIRVWAHNK